MRKGYSLISTLVAAIIIVIGISCVLIIIQNTEKIFTRSKNFQDFTIAADILNNKIQGEFSNPEKIVPEKIEGKMFGFHNLYYEICFSKIRENFYEVHIKLTRIVEGKKYSEEFISALHQR